MRTAKALKDERLTMVGEWRRLGRGRSGLEVFCEMMSSSGKGKTSLLTSRYGKSMLEQPAWMTDQIDHWKCEAQTSLLMSWT